MPSPVFSFGLVQEDLENALNAATVLALFDDGRGVVNASAMAACIQAAELELASWLVGAFGVALPPDLAVDPFLRRSAIEFACAFAIERHPEYAKQQGFGTATSYFERATARAQRIAAARQQATTIAETPANVGGAILAGGPRMYIDDAPCVVGRPGGVRVLQPGRSNSGDY